MAKEATNRFSNGRVANVKKEMSQNWNWRVVHWVDKLEFSFFPSIEKLYPPVCPTMPASFQAQGYRLRDWNKGKGRAKRGDDLNSTKNSSTPPHTQQGILHTPSHHPTHTTVYVLQWLVHPTHSRHNCTPFLLKAWGVQYPLLCVGWCAAGGSPTLLQVLCSTVKKTWL